MPKRKNTKQLRVADEVYEAADALQRRYALAFGKSVTWNFFGNLLIQKGVDGIEREIVSLLKEDRDTLP